MVKAEEMKCEEWRKQSWRANLETQPVGRWLERGLLTLAAVVQHRARVSHNRSLATLWGSRRLGGVAINNLGVRFARLAFAESTEW